MFVKLVKLTCIVTNRGAFKMVWNRIKNVQWTTKWKKKQNSRKFALISTCCIWAVLYMLDTMPFALISSTGYNATLLFPFFYYQFYFTNNNNDNSFQYRYIHVNHLHQFSYRCCVFYFRCLATGVNIKSRASRKLAIRWLNEVRI